MTVAIGCPVAAFADAAPFAMITAPAAPAAAVRRKKDRREIEGYVSAEGSEPEMKEEEYWDSFFNEPEGDE